VNPLDRLNVPGVSNLSTGPLAKGLKQIGSSVGGAIDTGFSSIGGLSSSVSSNGSLLSQASSFASQAKGALSSPVNALPLIDRAVSFGNAVSVASAKAKEVEVRSQLNQISTIT
jgi:hypothetical protein